MVVRFSACVKEHVLVSIGKKKRLLKVIWISRIHLSKKKKKKIWCLQLLFSSGKMKASFLGRRKGFTLIASVPCNCYSQFLFPVRPSFSVMKQIILWACGVRASCTPSRVRVCINKLEIIYISVQNKSKLSYPNPYTCSWIWSVSTLRFIFKAPYRHELFTKATSHSPKGLRIASRVRDGAEGGQLAHKNTANHVSLSCHEYCWFMPL